MHGVKKLGLRGAAVGGSVAGDEFANPKFHPFWAKAEELGVLIFIHPQSTPDLKNRFKGNGWLANTIGNPLDTTIALSHLIFEGTLDRFPKLKICSAHGGGKIYVDQNGAPVQKQAECDKCPSCAGAPAALATQTPIAQPVHFAYRAAVFAPLPDLTVAAARAPPRPPSQGPPIL